MTTQVSGETSIEVTDAPADGEAGGPALLSLDELAARVDLSVRTIRFYTSRGLVPPPIRRGRSGFYSPDHVARLELVKALQGHGFTLAAIERYVERIPADATPADIALHLSLLAPVTDERDVDVAEGMRRLGVPAAAAEATAEVYARHGEQVAAELSEIVRSLVWPGFREAGGTAEQLRELVHRIKPLTIAGLMRAYEKAIDDSSARFAGRERR